MWSDTQKIIVFNKFILIQDNMFNALKTKKNNIFKRIYIKDCILVFLLQFPFGFVRNHVLSILGHSHFCLLNKFNEKRKNSK